MPGKRILSDRQIDEMARLREKGWGDERIADHFTQRGTKVTASCIHWQCLRVGADRPKHLRGRSAPPPPAPYLRNGRPVRPYTPVEDQQLLALEAQGLSESEIGRRCGRKPNSIRGRLMTLARIEARREG